MRLCRSCGAANLEPGRYCRACGQLLVIPCAECGEELPDGAAFCPACGHPAGAAADEARLKIVTILFCDVVASTARIETMHPEDAHALMASFFEAMSEEIRREAGTIEKFIGDAIMAVFGVPVAHEDDPVRAVRAAQAMLERLEAWNAGRDAAARVQVRIGINTGEVMASGSTGRDTLVTGEAVNLAQRLEAAAEADSILIGERTARSVRDRFELVALEPLTIKGRSEPISAWRVGRRSPLPADGLPGASAPLVGREHELRLLRTLFDRVRAERRPSVATVVGDPGVGKTRLIAEFLVGLPSGVRVLSGRCAPYGEGVSLAPLAEILKREGGVLSSDSAAVALGKLAALGNRAIPQRLVEREQAIAGLAATVGLDAEGAPPGGRDPRDARRLLAITWRALLTGLSREGPLVVAIEEIHWADQAMLDLLIDLADQIEGPVFVVCLSRPDLFRLRPDWGAGRANYTSLQLDPLPAGESESLLAALLSGRELPADLASRILETAEGNPLFLEEIVRHLVDEGRIVSRDGRWVATGGVAVPDNVHSLILARLDLLPVTERQVVQHAAVVGRLFWPAAIREIGRFEALDEVLRNLQRRGLVVERLGSSIAGQTEYAFRHVLISEVAYETLPRAARGRSHAAVAGWLERHAGERAGELVEMLAHHYYLAFSYLADDELRVRARQSCLAAARSALRRFAIREAEMLGRRAVEISPPGPERVEALEALGDLYDLTFRGDGAWDAYVAATEELGGASSSRPQALSRLAAKAVVLALRWRVSMREARTDEEVEGLIRRGLEAAGSEVSRERALLLMSQSLLLTDTAEADLDPAANGEADARAALAIAESLADADLVSAALDALISSLRADASYAEIQPLTRRRLELIPEMSDPKEVCDAYAVAAAGAIVGGRYREAVDHATACIERARGTDAGQYLHGLILRTWSRFLLGEWDAALADHAAIEELEAEHDIPSAPALWAYGVAMLCRQLRGEDEEANRCLATLRTHLAPTARWARYYRNTAPMARALALRGEVAEASAVLRLDRGAYLPDNLEALCEVVGAMEDWDRAAAVVARTRSEAERATAPPLVFAADRLEGRAAAAAERWTAAEAALRRSTEGFDGLGSRWEAARTELLRGETLLRAGETDRAGSVLASARSRLRALGAVREAERADELVARLPSGSVLPSPGAPQTMPAKE